MIKLVNKDETTVTIYIPQGLISQVKELIKTKIDKNCVYYYDKQGKKIAVQVTITPKEFSLIKKNIQKEIKE